MQDKLELLGQILADQSPVLIAFSGGVDSAFLLAMAQRKIPGRFLGVIADSPSLPRQSLQDALTLARSLDAPLEVLQTEELENPQYASNPVNRCYFCKAELFQQMERLAGERGFATLAYGENADDAFHDRPGRVAAGEFRVAAPLHAAGLTKQEIRRYSREIGLPTADAPAQPCLSSRIPHGTAVTRDALALVEAGEAWVRKMGFVVFRVRYEPGNTAGARVQIASEEMGRLKGREAELAEGLRRAGFARVEIDPRGYRAPAAI